MEVTMVKLPIVIMVMKTEERNWNLGWSRRPKVLKYKCSTSITILNL
jgi:hypothetical protein